MSCDDLTLQAEREQRPLQLCVDCGATAAVDEAVQDFLAKYAIKGGA